MTEAIKNLKEKAKSLKHRNCFYDGATVEGLFLKTKN